MSIADLITQRSQPLDDLLAIPEKSAKRLLGVA
jgi:hypothetical protein